MTRFVTTQWLADNLNNPDVQIVDASWHMPNAGRDAHAEFVAGHIPGAVFFDIDAIADTSSGLPHMLPDAETFGKMAGALGLSEGKTIVVYDEHGLFSAPRVWWSLATMGARDVRLLEGGGPKWRAENRPLETGESKRAPTAFRARLKPGAVASFEDVFAASKAGGQIADARPAPRFAGEVPEPRPGLAAGHIPNSASVPFGELIADGRLRSTGEIAGTFARAGIDPQKPVITSCGSGVTAAVLALALDSIGAPDVALYDGSWSEWGARPNAPVETGKSRHK